MEKSQLRIAQEKHARRITKFRMWLDTQGIIYREGDAYRDPKVHGEFGVKMGYGSATSCHKYRLADDLIFDNDEDHIRAHDFWDELGGAPRILDDMNHYSSGWGKFR